jgi:hypothetical protein
MSTDGVEITAFATQVLDEPTSSASCCDGPKT